MLILGIDTSTANCSVGLVRDGRIVNHHCIVDRAVHSEKLLELVAQSLQGTNINALDAIAVSIGPGSYTGLRIGLATAKGLAFPRQLPVLPVPTLAVLERVARQEFDGAMVIFIKSHRDLIYYTEVPDSLKTIWKRPVGHESISRVVERFAPEYVFIGDSEIDLGHSRRSRLLYPRGDCTALLATEHYQELLPLNRPDLEPEYLSEMEIKSWRN